MKPVNGDVEVSGVVKMSATASGCRRGHSFKDVKDEKSPPG